MLTQNCYREHLLEITFLIFLLLKFYFQLDFCSEVAKYLARSSTSFTLWFPESVCMDCCCFPNSGAYYLGFLVDYNIGSRPNWFGCNNGGHCSITGILFYYAVVENTMAKLKYVPSCLYDKYFKCCKTKIANLF